jgi:hypothetical protein
MSRSSNALPALALLVLMSFLGCQRPAMTPQEKAEVIDQMNDLLAKRGKVEFRSWNGKWIGTDCDTDIVLRSGGIVEVVEYADAIARYDGKFQLDNDGVVSLHFEGIQTHWPVLMLEKDAKSLILRPKDRKVESEASGRRGYGYWPFRAFR